MTEIRRLAVIGAGTMGHGIAQTAARAGLDVLLCDADTAALDRGIVAIRSGVARLVERGKLAQQEADAVVARVRGVALLEDAAREADLVVEAVPESMDLKRTIFRALADATPIGTILASNTSSLSISRIAEAVEDRSRVVGMHFFNPVPVMPLLEVVRGAETTNETVEIATETGRRLGKEPIVVRDCPGFATSRLGVLLGLEAMRMLEQGVASAEDIDKAMTLGYRHPMGPLRLTDLVGLDIRLAIAEHLHRELGSEAFRPPEILRQMVEEGRLGKKAGRGFFEWSAD